MRRHRWVLLAYVGLSLLLTWPLVAHFGTRVPGDGIDDPSLAWNLWWARHAFVEQPQNPFAVNWQFWPVGINLAFYTLTLLNGLLSIPIQLVSGVVPAYNVLLLASFVLGGYGAYLLCLEVMGLGARAFGTRRREGDGEREARRTRRFAAAEYGAFIGGALYAFASAKMFYAALGQGNVASSEWVPFAALYLVRAARPGGRLRDAGLAGLFLVLQAYAEQTYASFLLIFAGLVFVWGVVRARAGGHRGTAPTTGRSGNIAKLLIRFILVGALFVAGIAPFLLNMLPDLRAEGDFFSAGGGFSDVFSADLAGYALPTQLHPVFGSLTRAIAGQGGFPVDKGQQIFVGYSALALAVVGAVAGRRSKRVVEQSGKLPAATGDDLANCPTFCGAWFWSISALLFFLLTLGPTLRVAGHDTGLPLPFALVAQLPFFKGNRYPSRYSVLLLMSVAPLVAMGAAYVIRHAAGLIRDTASSVTRNDASRTPALRAGANVTQQVSRFTSYVILAILLFEHLSLPLPTFDLSVPALYQKIAEQPGDFAVLEVPPGWRNGARVLGKQDIVIMQELWYQTAHGKRVLGGNTSRNPEFKFQYFAEDPTLARLIAQTNAADLPQHTALRETLAAQPVTDADRAQARAWVEFMNVRYVMVHRDKMPAETEALLRDLLPVTLVAEDGSLALYSLPALPAPTRFNIGTDEGRMALGEGWSPPATSGFFPREQLPAWAERSETRLLLPLPKEATRVRLFGQAAGPGQRVTLVVNGRAVGEQAMGGTVPVYLAFDVPADSGRPPLSDVRVRFAHVWPVDEAQQEMARQPMGSGMSSLGGLLVRSAGSETGDFAHIYVNGQDLSPNGRGYNLVALPGSDVATGALDATKAIAATFDTHLDPQASARMAAWIDALPPGTLVAGAVRDEGSMNLGEDAVQALASLGIKGDLRGHFRWGQAFIGTKGIAGGGMTGLVQESMDGVRPAQASTILGVDAPEIAAAVTQVIIGK